MSYICQTQFTLCYSRSNNKFLRSSNKQLILFIYTEYESQNDLWLRHFFPPTTILCGQHSQKTISDLTSFSTLSELIMKSNPPPSERMLEKLKYLASIFKSPSLQELRDKLLMDWSEDIPEVQSLPIPCCSNHLSQ